MAEAPRLGGRANGDRGPGLPFGCPWCQRQRRPRMSSCAGPCRARRPPQVRRCPAIRRCLCHGDGFVVEGRRNRARPASVVRLPPERADAEGRRSGPPGTSRRRLPSFFRCRREILACSPGLRFTGRSPGLFDFLLNHCHDDVIGWGRRSPGAIIIEYVTKPRLALLHRTLPKGCDQGAREWA